MVSSIAGYWLFKSEPHVFSIDDLAKNFREPWDGVRNYTVRNFMRDNMQVGDQAFFYHSSCASPGIVGTMEIVTVAYVDATVCNKHSPYFDPKISAKCIPWLAIDVCFSKKFNRLITLAELKSHTFLKNLRVVQPGNRLSITPVTRLEWDFIHDLQ